jgi:UDP-2,3-diacylglucosamine pyrophosphatase LpxH
MKIGRKMLTLAAIAVLSVGAVFAQNTVSKPAKPSNQSMASKMAEDQTASQSGKKKVDKHVHGHHHKKNKKHTSNTPTQDTTTKK